MDPSAAGEDEGLRDGRSVAVSITRRVRPGREPEFEAFLEGITDAVSRFPGYLDVRVFRPPRGSQEYRVVVRFDDEAHLRVWEESDERRTWNKRIADLIEDAPFIADITGTSQAQELRLALTPLESFVRTSVSGIGLLLLGTVLAVVAANSPLAAVYERFWTTDLTIAVGGFALSESLRHWVNDGLMALFFFVLGLEIKRELLVGELRSRRQAALPIAAAVGGAIVPALIYAALNWGGEGFRGWGIPMATDAAFSLGALSLLGSRVRPLLIVFLTAFAIVDDILAVLVIAIFYTEAISWTWLGVTAMLMVALIVANVAGFHRWPVYAVLGVGVWLALFESGIHATLAGVLVAMVVPARAWINPSEFLGRARGALDEFEAACYVAPTILSNEAQQRATQDLEQLCEEVETPMTHLQHQLNPWVAYGILPLFAFANAGVPLGSGFSQLLSSPVTWGVVAGLVLGKPLGITLFSWLAVRLGIAILPGAFTWRQILGVGWLGGIGFTISLFVAELAFVVGPLGNAARVGILVGSVVAGAIGYLILRAALPPRAEEDG
jgi:NhaA family Na+:H+ antiporter